MLTYFGYLLITLVAVVILQECALLLRPWPGNPPASDYRPFVSVLLCARNEEESIEECLESLMNQNYDAYEILVSNDHSVDQTKEKILRFIHHSPTSKIHFFDSPVQHTAEQNPKSAQLDYLLKHASGEFLAIADADCIYSTDWIESFASLAGQSDLLTSVTGVEKNIWQNGEWVGALGRISLIQWGKSYGAVGNNLFLRKSALVEVGGFSETRASAVEDMAINELFNKQGFITHFVISSGVKVMTQPTPAHQLMSQRKRWLSGLTHIPVLLRLSLYNQSLFLISILLLFFYDPWLAIPLWVSFTLLRAFTDIKILRKLRYYSPMKWVLPVEIYRQLILPILLFFHLFKGSFVWKDRSFNT